MSEHLSSDVDAMIARLLTERAPAEVEGRLRACLKDFHDCFRSNDLASRRDDDANKESSRLDMSRSVVDAGYYRYFKVRSVDRVVVIVATESFLQGTLLADLLKVELLHLASLYDPRRLVIDVQEVKLISSSVIAALINVQSRLGRCHIVLCGMSESLRYAFRTLNLESVFEMVPSVDEAVNVDIYESHQLPTEGPVSPPGEDY